MKKKHKYVPFEIKTPKTTSIIKVLVIWDDEIGDWIMPKQSLDEVEVAKCTQRLKELSHFEFMVGFHDSSDNFFLTFSPILGPETTIFNLTEKEMRYIRARITEALKEKSEINNHEKEKTK